MLTSPSFGPRIKRTIAKAQRIQKLVKELDELLEEGPRGIVDNSHQDRLKLSGRYMGLTRHLSASEKARVRKIRLSEGIEKAISEAEKLNTH